MQLHRKPMASTQCSNILSTRRVFLAAVINLSMPEKQSIHIHWATHPSHPHWRVWELRAPEGRAYFAPPPLSQLPEELETQNLEAGSHHNFFWWKFRDLRSTFSRSNDVINVKFSTFLVKRAGLRFSWSGSDGTQTKTDIFNPQKAFDTIVFLSLRQIERCPSWPKKSQLQNLTSRNLG